MGVSKATEPVARVIFRTAGEKCIIEGRLGAETAGHWSYLAQTSGELGMLDRSAIYGGFHIYEKTQNV